MKNHHHHHQPLLSKEDPEQPKGGGGETSHQEVSKDVQEVVEAWGLGSGAKPQTEPVEEDNLKEIVENKAEAEAPPAEAPPKADPPNETPEKGLNLSGKEWAAIRRDKKAQKNERAQKAQDYDQLKPEYERVQSEYETTKKALDEKAALIEQLQQKNKDLEEQHQSAGENYYNAYKAKATPQEDERYQKAATELEEILDRKLPVRNSLGRIDIRGLRDIQRNEDGIATESQTRKAQDSIIKNYAIEMYSQDRDSTRLDQIVSEFGSTIGLEVMPGDDSFNRIDQALKESSSKLIEMETISSEIKESEYQIHSQTYENKYKAWTDSFNRPYNLADEDIEKAFQESDGNDLTAIVGKLIKENPDIAETIKPKSAILAKAVSLMPDAIDPPPLASNDPTEIAAHQQQVAELSQVLGVVRENIGTWVVAASMLPDAIKALADRDARLEALIGQQSIESAGSAESDGVNGDSSDFVSAWKETASA